MSTEHGSHARQLARRLAGVLDRMATGPERPVAHLEGVRHVRELLELVEQGLITAALASGSDFGEVGRALGVSRQGARSRYKSRQLPDDEFDRWIAIQNRKRTRRKVA